MNILLVDDHHELRSATRELLEDLGNQVTDVADCVSALEEVNSRGSTLDAVVTDIRLPGMSGTDLLEALLAKECDLALLAYSSSRGDERLQKMLLGRKVIFLAKPFSAEQLHAKLHRANLARRWSAPTQASPRDRSSEAGSHLFSTSEQASDSPPDSSFPSPSPRTRHSGYRSLALAASVVLALATGSWVFHQLPHAPPLPERSSETLRRGAHFELESPLGEVSARPTELIWQRVPQAKKYRVCLLDVEDIVLWKGLLDPSLLVSGEGESADRDSIAMPLPPEVASALNPAVVYYWRVDALDEGDAIVASSKRERFLMRPGSAFPISLAFSQPVPAGGAS